MTVFDAYSKYYDLLYRDKNYATESQFIMDVCEKFSDGRKLLDLGCGTAKHAQELVARGFDVFGVEMSERMFERARETQQLLPANAATHLRLQCADALNFRVNEKFNIVTALFHVISYQTSNDKLRAFFATAASHLDVGGTFIFDCWYGPAVLRMLPEPRIKVVEDGECEVIRFANPRLRINDNVVEVHYRILVKSRQSGYWSDLNERHDMRYLFLPEIHFLAREAGFEVIDAREFLSGKALDEHTWGACFVTRRV